MLDFIYEYIVKNDFKIKEHLSSDFHDIFLIEDILKNKKLIKYIKGKRRPKIVIKDIYYRLLKQSHKNIISIYDIVEIENDFFIIMEYFEGINLNKYIKQNFYTSINISIFRSIFNDIANTIDFINNIGLMHTDIIGHNILINDMLEIKIIDFDFAIILENENFVNIDVQSFIIMFFQYVNEYNYLNNKYNLYENTNIFNFNNYELEMNSCNTFLNSLDFFNKEFK